ncbi:LCP family protein [Cryptosporangium sp. NPDC048952]|uniref:LCP family protein n=1 Tax=Cryptosporangium sp. NPDC048952 TaxID=3363961 RepID=UPI00371975D2
MQSWRALRSRQVWKRLLLVLFAFGLAICVTTYGVVAYYSSQVKRAPLLEQSTSPARQGESALNLLVFGSDSDGRDLVGEEPTLDSIMLVHVDRRMGRATVIAIPRGAHVAVPREGAWNGDKTTLDRAVVLGGPTLVTRTVSELIGIRLDGAIVVDLNSVSHVVDAVGGIEICLESAEALPDGSSRKKGCQKLSGRQATTFMRARTLGQSTDFDRINDQQRVLKALIDRAASAGVLANPLRLKELLGATALSLVVDEGLDLPRLALAMRSIRPGDVEFATVPVKRLDLPTPDGPAVELDPLLAPQLFASIRDDKVGDWLARHRVDTPK